MDGDGGAGELVFLEELEAERAEEGIVGAATREEEAEEEALFQQRLTDLLDTDSAYAGELARQLQQGRGLRVRKQVDYNERRGRRHVAGASRFPVDARPKRAVKDDELEQQVASEVGLPTLSAEEEEMLPPHVIKRQDEYMKVRNHVLARWRADVQRYLPKADAAAHVWNKKLRDLVPYAWDFLNTHGFINFGAKLEGVPSLDAAAAQSMGSVVVIGAGLAGAAAACQLQRWGYTVLLLEGRNRPGGRVYTARLEGGGYSGAADLGGSIITGTDGNPLAVLARQLKIPMHSILTKCPLYLEGGGEEPDKEQDEQAEVSFSALLDRCSEYRDSLGAIADMISVGTALDTLFADLPAFEDPWRQALRQHLFGWHLANVEFANAARAETLSLRAWDQDDPYELMGEHVYLPGGNVRLVEGLLEDVPVLYNSVVSRIEYGDGADASGPSGSGGGGGDSGGKVTVTSSAGTFEVDAVVVTVPLGVLKQNKIAFEPELPEAKRIAIHRLGFGVLNKLVLLFPSVFWDDSIDMFGHVHTSDDPSERGLFYLFYSYSGLAGGAVLAALVAGEAALTFEKAPIEASVARIMRVLRGIHSPKGIVVPDPVQADATRWGSDPMSYGSYSSVAVGSVGGDDYDTIAEPVAGRVFFGGEATIRKWPATMHGAFLSGLREAARVARAFPPRARVHGSGHGEKKGGGAAVAAKDGAIAAAAAGREGAKGAEEEADESEERWESSSSSGDSDGSGSSDNSSDTDFAAGHRGAKRSGGHERRSKRRRGGGGSPAASDGSGGSGPDKLSVPVHKTAHVAVALRALFDGAVVPDVEFGAFSAFEVPEGGLAEHSGRPGLSIVQINFAAMRGAPAVRHVVHLVLLSAQVSTLRDVRGGDDARISVLESDMGVKLLGRPAPGPELEGMVLAVARAKGLHLETFPFSTGASIVL
ncbi:hypothetical protein FOA52_000650 [Chlamydomonas sp. UWO 241]|nr:hypothetical protein FOA52_000650 [Chlamydomonas sp. UWO 241]